MLAALFILVGAAAIAAFVLIRMKLGTPEKRSVIKSEVSAIKSGGVAESAPADAEGVNKNATGRTTNVARDSEVNQPSQDVGFGDEDMSEYQDISEGFDDSGSGLGATSVTASKPRPAPKRPPQPKRSA